jgi:D-ribulokinase
MAPHFIGIDVGTGSARAGIFDRTGVMVAKAKRDIALYRDGADIAEQSSRDIWRAVCASVREAVSAAGLSAGDIAGLGFDATCSLVVLGPGGAPLPVGTSGDPERDIVVWMDHRAIGQAERINRTGHKVLSYVGGRISPEMETPKLLWLKENLPDTYGAAWQFFDLADFLTWRATGSLARSVCTVTCKWTYLAHEKRWDAGYFREIGLGDLADDGFARIGTEIIVPGAPLGQGLTEEAARALGLAPGTPVAAGLIDAHAGGVGSVGGQSSGGSAKESATSRMAYVFGTSACTMMSSTEPLFIPGVWGPYYSAMVPELWLSEGGQSAAGAAIDHLVSMHPASREVAAAAEAAGMSLPELLAEDARTASASLSDAARLADRLHVVPDFLGNRAPFADPNARGVIAGLGLETDRRSLVSLYIAGLLGLGYGLRQIIAASRDKGAAVDAIALSGGAGQSPLVRQLIADSTGIPVLVSRESDPVLLGSAMLAAVAGGAFDTLQAAMAGMSAVGERYEPATGEIADLHRRRFTSFEALQKTASSL